MEERLKGLEDDNDHLHTLLSSLAAENEGLKEQIASLNRGAAAPLFVSPFPAAAAAGALRPSARGTTEPAVLTYLATLLVLYLCLESKGLYQAASLVLFTTLFMASSACARKGRRGAGPWAAVRGLPGLQRPRELLAGAKLATCAHRSFTRLFSLLPGCLAAYSALVVGSMHCIVANNMRSKLASVASVLPHCPDGPCEAAPDEGGRALMEDAPDPFGRLSPGPPHASQRGSSLIAGLVKTAQMAVH